MVMPLWQPSKTLVQRTNMTRFFAYLNVRHGMSFDHYAPAHQWSIDHPEAFWDAVWDFTEIVATTKGEVILANKEKMPGAQWFPEARLNFAENLLRRRDGGDAVIFQGESQSLRRLSFAKLYTQVSQISQALRAQGVGLGDRVVGYLPNMPEAVIAMLGAASIGAIWSSCSPDFGVRGVVDRFGQISPKVLFACDGYFYNGQSINTLDRLGDIEKELPSLERVVVVPYVSSELKLDALTKSQSWEDFYVQQTPGEIEFTSLPFNHPLYIMYSSGTTGVPKCIVHSAGGTLVQHLKEHQFHADVHSGDKLFYFTTCGWMMWNWLVSGLASGATLVLYDGSPFYPSGEVLFDLIDKVNIDIFGTSAKFIDAVKKAGLTPLRTHKLSSMRTVLSTGSPLAPESFDFIYDAVKPDVRLSSITGGTDIVGCFAQGSPNLPVWRGELQCPALGMAVEVWSDDAVPMEVGEKGELVCTQPFPSMPIGFWNDPDGEKYHAAYFARFPNVWCHGDYVALTERGGMVVYGRSDTVLNPGGVRIGTAEIYRQVERLDEVLEGLVIGQDWGGNTRIVLFVVLETPLTLDDALRDKIRQCIRENTTPRHVPTRVIQVPELPRTKSGKIVELAVREIVHGRPVKNKEALANPEALAHFLACTELQV